MKRLITLSLALILGVAVGTTMLMPRNAEAVGGLLFGQAELIEFSNDQVVNRVVVRINKGWLNSDNFTLGITITGLNDGPHEHGYQEVHLRTTEVLDTENNTAYVGIDWNTDIAPTHSSETYTVCVKIMNNGAETCNDFGPY